MGSSLFAVIQLHLGQILQTIGLIFDVIGVVLIVNFFRRVTYKEDTPFGLPSDLPSLLAELANGAIPGSIFLVLGFIFQLIGVWI